MHHFNQTLSCMVWLVNLDSEKMNKCIDIGICDTLLTPDLIEILLNLLSKTKNLGATHSIYSINFIL